MAQTGRKHREIRFSVGTNGGKTSGARRQERVRLAQLAVCLFLFLAMLVGRGVFPSKLAQIRDQVLKALTDNIDFQTAFAQLGESLSQGESVWGDLGEFCVEVFGPSESSQEDSGKSSLPIPQLTGLMTAESRFLSENPDATALARHFLREGEQSALWPAQTQESRTESIQPEPQAAVPAVGTVLLKSDYDGQALPQNYTMDQLSLGGLETMTPVLGHINSVYGYRDHPINGKYQFHGGVDIGAQMGDPILAFAAGTVEYVGEDDSYGLYFQLDHGNGIKSFYAHCSAVCVTKGEAVTLGQKVAEVGASGMATGPHLHLELKYDRTHLNPIYYIEYLTNQ